MINWLQSWSFLLAVALIGTFIGLEAAYRLLENSNEKRVPASKKRTWVGEGGEVISKVSLIAGQIRIEGRGVVLSVKCHDSVQGDIPRGTRVIISGFIESSGDYVVSPKKEQRA